MNKLLSNRQAGVGHLGLIVGVVVVLAIGGVGYFVFNKNKSGDSSSNNTASSEAVEAIKNAVCSYDDKDLCKFFKGFEAQQYYTVTGTSSDTDGTTGDITIQWQGDKSYLKMTGGGLNWEVMTLGNTNYTKASDGTWWKEAVDPNDPNEVTTDDYKPELDEPADNAAVAARYKSLGKEACGNLTCFKYQEIDPEDPNDIQYFWFDDEDYLWRRYHSESDGSKMDITVSFTKFSLSEPKPVKELQEGQFIFPGAEGPTSL